MKCSGHILHLSRYLYDHLLLAFLSAFQSLKQLILTEDRPRLPSLIAFAYDCRIVHGQTCPRSPIRRRLLTA
jgi:hypothetical protein